MCVHVIKINERGHESEREQEGLCGQTCRGETENFKYDFKN